MPKSKKLFGQVKPIKTPKPSAKAPKALKTPKALKPKKATKTPDWMKPPKSQFKEGDGPIPTNALILPKKK